MNNTTHCHSFLNQSTHAREKVKLCEFCRSYKKGGVNAKMQGKRLIHSTLSFNLYRLFDSKRFDFEIETPLANGDCSSLKTSDNARLSKWLENSGVCADRLQSLDFLNHGLQS